MSDDLRTRTVIVTGVSKEVGRAIALGFAEAGSRVMLADEDEAVLGELVETIRERDGEAARFHFDTRDRLSATNLIAATLDAFGDLDILVNDMPASTPADFLELSADALSETMERAVGSSFMLGQMAARRMVAQGEADPDFNGVIVNITSIAAKQTVPELLSYSVACAAIDQLTRSMAAALAGYRIRVNAVALGAVMTETMRATFREHEDLREDLVRVTPLGRLGEPDEAAAAVLFLASDRAGFITGQILAVDGGRTVLDAFAAPLG